MHSQPRDEQMKLHIYDFLVTSPLVSVAAVLGLKFKFSVQFLYD